MKKQVLRSQKGGYNKAAVISKLDAYNTLIVAIQQGNMSRSEVMTELEYIRKMRMPTEKKGLFGEAGFSVEDTDAYIDECEHLIQNGAMNLR